MKPEDRAVLDKLFTEYIGNNHTNDIERHCALHFFKAALAHRDAQPAVAQEPVGYQFRTRPVHHRGKGWSSWEPCDKQLFDACIKIPVNNDLEFEVRKVYAEAPAVAVNEQMRTALEGLLAITRDSQGVAGYHLNGEVAKWDEFEEVSAAEAAKKGGV